MRTLGGALVAAALAGCAAGGTRPPGMSPPPPPSAPVAPLTAEQRLISGQKRLEASDYASAEADFRAATAGKSRAPALLGLAQTLLVTGRYEAAVTTAREAAVAGADTALEAAVVEGEALRRQGKLEEAESALRRVEKTPEARRARLLLGEVLLERGKRSEASVPLMTVIEDYNDERIAPGDGRGLAMVGRAAHLLRSPKDANDAFNEAERALEGDVRTLLWRAELFLEKYDPGHAEEVVREILKQAPNHPEANVWLSHVKLAQTLDFDEAERLAKKALSQNPRLGAAYFVLAGTALRDMELEVADAQLDAGLKHNPRDLDLLSLKATVRFLADDEAGFERAKRGVLELNPAYTRLYAILAEYADWEHRYDEIVAMMREAIAIDAQDATALAQLGINLLRAGDDAQGLSALRNAFGKDPFNVRVFNTLNLYEKDVASNYTSASYKRFTIRYHREEKAILERYVPELLDRAYGEMVERYGIEPATPIGIELYAERQNFAIRTSGLPTTAIQGVCFGRTLASMSPKNESFNLGMTLWHELAHVFHIQLSKSRVPRWFTEGLAEYETLVERPEWSREHDPDLYEALRSARLPQVASMNRAFTRAEELSDVATAYYAASQILVMLNEQHGAKKMARMLELWGQGQRSDAVIRGALGVGPAELDRGFRSWADKRLVRYRSQFVPVSRSGSIERARDEARAAPRDARKRAIFALAVLRAGNRADAKKLLVEALKLDPKQPDARYFSAELAIAERDFKRGEKLARELVADRHDGYAVQMLLVEAARLKKDVAGLRATLEAAHRHDPRQSEPLVGLSEVMRQTGNADEEINALKKLVELEQHEPGPYRRLLRLLLEKRRFEEARAIGEAGIWADVEGLEIHTSFAEALAASGDPKRALFELETALLCPGRPHEKAEVHAVFAETYLKLKNRPLALRHAKLGRELMPDNARIKKLGL
jgi:cellulose synthase operon protein C